VKEDLQKHETGTGDLYVHGQSTFHATWVFTPGAAFGAVHCSAWNQEFPTPIERMMWINSSLVSVIIPIGALITNDVCLEKVAIFNKLAIHLSHNKRTNKQPIVWVVYVILGSLFCLASGFLIVEAFVSVRDLPGSVYVTAGWSGYFPHA
jgi:hypothetical protein